MTYGTIHYARTHGPITREVADWVAAELRRSATAWEGLSGMGRGDGDAVAEHLANVVAPNLLEAAAEQGREEPGEVAALVETLARPWVGRVAGAPAAPDARAVLEALADVFAGRNPGPSAPGPAGVFALAAPAVMVRP